MGIIKEPPGIDLNIGPLPLTNEDREAVSAIIARYKSTGEIPKPGRKPKSIKRKKPAVSSEIKHTKASHKTANKKLVNL